MRARSFDSGAFQGSRLGTERGIVGIGEPLEAVPETLEEAVNRTAESHGDKAARMLVRFAGLPEGSLVWTRTSDDVFRLGKVIGPWWYDDSEAAGRSGIHQVRAADWIPCNFDSAATPEAVISTFDRGGKNFQRIISREAERRSKRLWTWKRGRG
ncbi:MAG: hypothetical protein QG596_38 [Actinomycetota bacterium]|jgi:hypothetical protein|nr:hypothetical protein [Actinomycetota bacterium]